LLRRADRSDQAETGRGFEIHALAPPLEVVAASSTIILNGVLIWKVATANHLSEVLSEALIFTSAINLALILVCAFVAYSYSTKERKLRKALIDNARLETVAQAEAVQNTRIAQQRALISARHAEYCVLLRSTAARVGTITEEHFLSYLGDMLNLTAELFDFITNDKCSACIKVFVRGEGEAPDNKIANGHLVTTLQRDSKSRQTRRYVDEKIPTYDYTSNAAFRAILDEDEPDWFSENNLKGLGRQYYNRNKEYGKYYNATTVVPIKLFGKSTNEECSGLLCVDNMNGGFDAGRCVEILNGIAVDLYYAIGTTAGLRAQNQELVK
jgi:Lhr-like helicase